MPDFWWGCSKAQQILLANPNNAYVKQPASSFLLLLASLPSFFIIWIWNSRLTGEHWGQRSWCFFFHRVLVPFVFGLYSNNQEKVSISYPKSMHFLPCFDLGQAHLRAKCSPAEWKYPYNFHHMPRPAASSLAQLHA